MKQNYLKIAQLLVFFLISGTAVLAQDYAWMKGSNAVNAHGTYGTIGTPALSNTPGSREVPCSWTDASGNLWLFGGVGRGASGNNGFLNDLWKYTPSTNEWVWVKGNSSVDHNGVYGSIGVAAAANNPGSREGAMSWADASGNLWLFGGIGFDATSNLGELNDLWKYNIATNQWTWVKGGTVTFTGGTYGTQGTAAMTNQPGGRAFGSTWADASGNLWLLAAWGMTHLVITAPSTICGNIP